MADSKKKDEVFLFAVTKKYGSRKVGQVLKESRETRRKMREGGCLEKISESALKEKRKKEAEEKMQKDFSKNKMQDNGLVNNKDGK